MLARRIPLKHAVSRLLASAAAVLGVLAAAPGAEAQLVFDRLVLVPAHLTSGVGTVRLDGMGGFETTVRDENQEINLLDFANNPAGFGDDRDSWTIDLRYDHQEVTEGVQYSYGDDVKINTGSLLLGYHHPGNIGIGGAIDYAEVGARDITRSRDEFRVVGFSLTANKYFTKGLVLGARVTQTDEKQDAYSRQVYNISHSTALLRSGLGLGVTPVRGVTIGARGEIISNKVDGESRGTTHQDTFDWKRPGSLWAVHGLVDRGRLTGGVDYSRQDLEGREDVQISWSERFILNPTPDSYVAEAPTISEDRTNEVLRTRWRLQVVPRKISVSVATLNATEDYTIIANPNVLGSLPPGTLNTTNDVLIGGVSWITAGQRLLVAGEAKAASIEVDQADEYGSSKLKQEELALRIGGEYLIGETLAGRLGLIQARENYEVDGAKSDDYSTTYVTAGLGIIPDGAIWQLDISYGVIVDSDLATDSSRFSAYLKYLF